MVGDRQWQERPWEHPTQGDASRHLMPSQHLEPLSLKSGLLSSALPIRLPRYHLNKAQEALKKIINVCKVQPLHVQQTPLLCQALLLTDEEQRWAGSWPKSHGAGQGAESGAPASTATWVQHRPHTPRPPLQETGRHTRGCPKPSLQQRGPSCASTRPPVAWVSSLAC